MRDKLKKAIANRTIFYIAFCYFLSILGFSNISLRGLEIRNKIFRKLQKKYQRFSSHLAFNPELDECSIKVLTGPDISKIDADNIWICWFQGFDEAPALVTRCLESIQKHMPDKKIHLITADNMSNFVLFPSWVTSKWKAGIISDAHLSDMLRLELLIRYGGVWLDATTYLTDALPEYVYNRDLFMYICNTSDLTSVYHSWLIYSKKNHRVLQNTRALLYEYWRRKNHLCEYFLWHLFMTMSIEKYPQDAHDIHYIVGEPNHMLARNWSKQFDPVYWAELKKITPVQKLSTKRIPQSDYSGTYYDLLLRGTLNKESK